MPYCTQADVEDILSREGVRLSTDDDRTLAEASDTIVDNAIERAESKINQYALRQYEVASLTGNTWVKWCCAVFAAVEIARRRGNPVPSSLEDAYNEYLAYLKEVAEGQQIIPGATLYAEPGPMMSNLRYDHRYRQNKVRVLTHSSAGRQSSDKPRRVDIGQFYHDR